MNQRQIEAVYLKHKLMSIKELREVYYFTLLSFYRHYNSAMLIKKAGDIYSSFNSFFIATEEGIKAYFIHLFLKERFDGKEIPKEVFEFVFTKFTEHKKKWDEAIQVLIARFKNQMESDKNEMLIYNYLFSQRKLRQKENLTPNELKELKDWEHENIIHNAVLKKYAEIIAMLNTNNFYELKLKSIYVDYSLAKHKFEYPEMTINDDIWMKMKNVASGIGKINRHLIELNNEKFKQNNIDPIDIYSFDKYYSYNFFLKNNP